MEQPGIFKYWTEWDPNEGSRSGLNMMAVKDNKMYLITEYKKDKDSIEVEFHWENGFALKILESVYRGSDDLFGVVKTRSLQWLSNEKRWGIWRQK